VSGQRLEHVGRATRGVTFDTGALIALERRKAGALALLRACRLAKARITIPAAVVAEWWRGQHSALLEGCTLESLSPELARAAGMLLVQTGGANAIDAIVIASAAQRGDLVVTSDRSDLEELARHVRGVDVERVP
jgi:predicted nucleic acid-binding protein